MINVTGVFKQLTDRDFRVLTAIETGMRFYQWVPVEELPKYANTDIKEVRYIISRLAKEKLIVFTDEPYEGCRIYFEAYDMLALNTFVARDTLKALGDIVGVGKESVVFDGIGRMDRHVAIKFHREGRTSFKQVKRVREHIGDRRHLSWLYASRLAAKKEYDALLALYPKVSVPEPIDHNRHTIVMAFVAGVSLDHAKLDDPEWFLEKILEEVKKTCSLGLIHADLSEFNVFVDPAGIRIIDWPQCIKTNHPESGNILRRDLQNVLTFFERKYGIKKDIEKVIVQVSC